MISRISGTIVERGVNFVVIEVNGIGYTVYTTPDNASSFSELVTLFTHLVVRENVLDLYGFETREEADFFEMLTSVSGIGPRSAIAILGIADVLTLKKATAAGDISYLTKVSGIGKKSAEKIVLELRDKIGGSDGHSREGEGDLLDALRSLGYTSSEARNALKEVPDDIEDQSERLKHALKLLGK